MTSYRERKLGPIANDMAQLESDISHLADELLRLNRENERLTEENELLKARPTNAEWVEICTKNTELRAKLNTMVGNFDVLYARDREADKPIALKEERWLCAKCGGRNYGFARKSCAFCPALNPNGPKPMIKDEDQRTDDERWICECGAVNNVTSIACAFCQAKNPGQGKELCACGHRYNQHKTNTNMCSGCDCSQKHSGRCSGPIEDSLKQFDTVEEMEDAETIKILKQRTNICVCNHAKSEHWYDPFEQDLMCRNGGCRCEKFQPKDKEQ